VYETVERAEAKAAELLQLREQERERRQFARAIERNAQGQAIIRTSASTNDAREVLVDEHLWHELAKTNWSWNGNYDYPSGQVHGKRVTLHRFVFSLTHHKDIPEGWQVDHINHDPGDARLESLRLLTPAENLHARRKFKGTSSPFVGVYHDKRCTIRPWIATIRVQGQQRRIGRFATKEEAHAAHRVVQRRHMRAVMSLTLLSNDSPPFSSIERH
jgi:hypothetical protein